MSHITLAQMSNSCVLGLAMTMPSKRKVLFLHGTERVQDLPPTNITRRPLVIGGCPPELLPDGGLPLHLEAILIPIKPEN